MDTFWQTETGGHVITPPPGAWFPNPVHLGIMVTLVDVAGH
jgi:acyl-coenzyme A synthetase/AMP-(fatty) acid ligase